MKRSILVAAALALFFSPCVEAGTIGIWKDKRIGNLSGIVNTLTNSGWKVKWLSQHREKIDGKNRNVNDLEQADRIAQCDVLLFTGGWGRYFFPSAAARREIIRYAASGGGVLLCGYRGGYPRTANRPMFPEVAEVNNRLSSGWLFPEGDSMLAKAFGGKPLLAGSGDHLTLKMGPDGTSFVGNSGDAVGACSDFGFGRVIVYGGHFSYSPGDDMSVENDRIFLAALKYLTGRKKPSAAAAAKAADEAEARFIRRERMWDLTLDERGPDSMAGIIPMARDSVIAVPESLAFKLEYFAGFLGGDDAKKCLATAGELHAEVAAVRAEAVKTKDAACAGLESMGLEDLRVFKINESPWSKEAVSSRFSKIVDEKRTVNAEALIALMKPKVKAVKLAAIDRELKKDLEMVPALLEKTASSKAKERCEAAMELGRIQPGDRKSLETLVALLDDPDSRVRSQAAVSLGWMQAKGAVGALVEKTASDCVWTRRRAVQALGNIGDERAAEALLKALDDKDLDVRQLAVISLGYVKARRAVGKLLEIAKGDADKYAHMQDIAIYALGFIGEKSVAPEIEKIIENTEHDGPFQGRGNRIWPLKNMLSFGAHGTGRIQLGKHIAVKEALKLIANGGRAEKGVRQMKERRSKDIFYAVTGNCNAFAGRIWGGTRATFGGEKLKYLFPHLKEAGFTGIHNAWGLSSLNEDSYLDFLREADDLGLIVIDPNPGYAKADKGIFTYRMEYTDSIPCLSGIWEEETWPVPGMSREEFVTRARALYGSDWKKGAGLNAAESAEIEALLEKHPVVKFTDFCPMAKTKDENFSAPWNGRLRSLLLEIEGDKLRDTWRESQDYVQASRMGTAHTFVISTADPARFPNDGEALAQLDSVGLESYQSFGRSTAYFMQRYRDGEGRSSMSELYNWYCPSPEHAVRGFWQNAIHSKCFYNFALYHIFKYASSEYLWVWDNGRWDKAREVFKRVADNREYYRIKPSAANVAVLFSARSTSMSSESNFSQCPVPQRGDQNAMAVWTALGQLQIPADVVYADAVSLEKLSKYDVLYLTNSKYLGDKGIESIREWVAKGGVLVSDGGTSIFDGRTLAARRNYALADVFGVDYLGTEFLPADRHDTFCRRRGVKLSAYKFVGDLKRPYHFEDHVHRDLKPVKSVTEMTIAPEGAEFLSGVKPGATVEIDAALGIDKVKETTARKIASFADGKGALFVNEFGKGRCYFFASNYPMMGHVVSEWQMMPNKFDFWKNVTASLGAIVKGAFAKKGVSAPVEVTGVCGDVEVTVDDHGDKYVVHMLDYNVRSKGVKGAVLTIPGTRAIKRVWYPDTKTELRLEGRSVKLREFLPYDMVAVEFN